MEKLRVGMIGTGFIGWLHARIFHESYGAELVAIGRAGGADEGQEGIGHEAPRAGREPRFGLGSEPAVSV